MVTTVSYASAKRTDVPVNVLCCADKCDAPIMDPVSPVPLCPTHLRLAWEHGNKMIHDADMGAVVRLADAAAKTDHDQWVRGHRFMLQPGWIYFARARGFIKIGWSNDPRPPPT